MAQYYYSKEIRNDYLGTSKSDLPDGWPLLSENLGFDDAFMVQ
jgi:hypothetical protein